MPIIIIFVINGRVFFHWQRADKSRPATAQSINVLRLSNVIILHYKQASEECEWIFEEERKSRMICWQDWGWGSDLCEAVFEVLKSLIRSYGGIRVFSRIEYDAFLSISRIDSGPILSRNWLPLNFDVSLISSTLGVFLNRESTADRISIALKPYYLE